MVLAEKEESDVDVAMSVAIMETILTKDVDVIAIGTRDADFLPVVQKAKEYGKKVIVFGVESAFSASLKNCADIVEVL